MDIDQNPALIAFAVGLLRNRISLIHDPDEESLKNAEKFIEDRVAKWHKISEKQLATLLLEEMNDYEFLRA